MKNNKDSYGLGTALTGGFIFILSAVIVLFLLSALFAGYAYTYSPQVTHYPLAKEAVELYNRKHPKNKLTEQELLWIAQGSHDEDRPAIRAQHHFYDPVNNSGLEGLMSSKEWAHNAGMQSLNRYQAGGQSSGIHTWEEAISAYNKGDKEHAYKSLGHIFHLIQDATVPAHTRGDAHVHVDLKIAELDIFGGADPLEQEVKSLGVPSSGNMQPVYLSSIDQYFDHVATYSNNNFWSKDTVGKYELPKITKVDKEYIYTDINRDEYKLAKFDSGSKTNLFGNTTELNFSDPLVVRDYWQRLAPVSIKTTAGILKLFHDNVQEPEAAKELSFWQKAKNSFGSIKDSIKSRITALADTSKFVSSSIQVETAPAHSDPTVNLLTTGPPVGYNMSVSHASEKEKKQAQQRFKDQLEKALKNQSQETQLNGGVPGTPPAGSNAGPSDSPLANTAPPGGAMLGKTQETVQEYLVTRVIDGDTIELSNGSRVRYIGVNAPEDPEGCFSKEASELNKQLVLNKKVKLLSGPNNEDDYGRLLRYVYIGDTLVNKELIETGHAYAFDYGFTHKYTDKFKSIGEQAKKEARGLWGQACHPAEKLVNKVKEKTKEIVKDPTAAFGGYGPNTGRGLGYVFSQDEIESGKNNEEDSGNSSHPEPVEGSHANPAESLIIQEVQVDTVEYVKLYNSSNESVSLSGYHLSYYSSSRTEWSDPYRNWELPEEALISANNSYTIEVFDQNNALQEDLALTTSLGKAYSSEQLSNSKGAVAIFNSDPKDGAEPIDSFGWGGHPLAEDAEEGPKDDASEEEELPAGSSTGTPIWGLWQGNTLNSGHSSTEGPKESPNIAWQKQFIGNNTSQPLIDPSGNIYVSIEGRSGPASGKIVSYTPSGQKRWSHPGSARIALSSNSSYLYAAVQNGLIVFNVQDGSIHAFTDIDFGPQALKELAVGPSGGSVYIVSVNNIYRFDKEGGLLWKKDWHILDWSGIFGRSHNGYSKVESVYNPMLLNSTLYTVVLPDNGWGNPGQFLAAVNAETGELLWQRGLRQTLPGWGPGIRNVYPDPVINSQGDLFIGFRDTGVKSRTGFAIYDVKDKGKLVRKVTTSARFTSSILGLDSLGNAFYSDRYSTVHYYDIIFGHKYFFNAPNGSRITSRMAVDAGNRLYIGISNGTVYAINSDSTNVEPSIAWEHSFEGSTPIHISLGRGVVYAVSSSKNNSLTLSALK